MPADHYQESTYGDAIADTYDDLYGTFLADPVQIKVLADLAGDGPAVEIGSGTGRVALPLARVGVPVVGIDASGEMTRQLHRSAVAEGLAVTAVEADAAAFTVADPVPLVYAVFNTFFLLADPCQFPGDCRASRRDSRESGDARLRRYLRHSPN
ncbi:MULTISPECIES: class I SAM-dependent methyltransferase [unclassified Frankia]|uniref:class I SAM-dependent methyltransferase n=1 Tax=unclassified Frankia TaxID=2632575 RepID=UPI001EF70F77|nr:MULTISPECIES: class I SAM-dependent methyltransferase [unclassified Frankia]